MVKGVLSKKNMLKLMKATEEATKLKGKGKGKGTKAKEVDMIKIEENLLTQQS